MGIMKVNRDKLSDTGKTLYDKLYRIFNDDEFVLGVLIDVKTDSEKQELLDYIEEVKDISSEEVILKSLTINEERKLHLLR
jgi:hypothetical protein